MLRAPVVRRRPARRRSVIGRCKSRTLAPRARACVLISSPGSAMMRAWSCSAKAVTSSKGRCLLGARLARRVLVPVVVANARRRAFVASASTCARWVRTSASICSARDSVFIPPASEGDRCFATLPLNGYGESTSVSGIPLPGGTTADLLDIVPTGADDPPLDGAPAPVLDGTTYRDVVPDTNLNYIVTVDRDAVPSVPGEPLLYRVTVHLDTDYRAGSVTQEYWIVSPPRRE